MSGTHFDDVTSAAISAFHDASLARNAHGNPETISFSDDVWPLIETNHRCNSLLWDEEDRARRKDVADA